MKCFVENFKKGKYDLRLLLWGCCHVFLWPGLRFYSVHQIWRQSIHAFLPWVSSTSGRILRAIERTMGSYRHGIWWLNDVRMYKSLFSSAFAFIMLVRKWKKLFLAAGLQTYWNYQYYKMFKNGVHMVLFGLNKKHTKFMCG